MAKTQVQQSKAPFIFCLIGVILGFLSTIGGIINYFLFKNLDSGFFSGFFGNFGFNFSGFLVYSLSVSIIGFIICIALAFYIAKINQEFSKKNFIIITVLGGIGLFTGLSLGAVLILIGGIIGIVKSP